jgi:ATP-dependent exoDNAse (exonuclease V) beta subunit
MNLPSDQAERDQFAQAIDSNFSVVASAGSGKTHAITERILAIAASRHAREWLPQLVVVTFTNRAADEMQQRARQRLLESGASLEVSEAFNRAFFGTIHSFCLKLLRAHGHRLGLKANPELVTNDTALWREFVQQTTTIGHTLEPEQRRFLFRLVSAASVMELGRSSKLAGHEAAAPGTCDDVDLEDLLALVPNRSNARANVERSQRAAREWKRVLNETTEFAPLPEMFGTAADLREVWASTFGPLREWIQRAARCVGCEVAGDFREFCLKRGVVSYDDQVTLALRLFNDPEIARRIREKNYRVILDEAQDTDPEQFMVLLHAAGAPSHAAGGSGALAAPSNWPPDCVAPRPGHFCMVGDFQQSIYGKRADLGFYRKIHNALITSPGGSGLRFTVTFRLDSEAIAFVNQSFPRVFRPDDGQVSFQPLEPRPGILPGQVIRLSLPISDCVNDSEKARIESEFLAHWLKSAGLESLRANQWSDVAILCPRKSWFSALRAALRRLGFEVQLQSEREVRGDHPAVAWFTALVVVLSEPRNAFEIVGVLREIFGMSDHELVAFTARDSARLNIADAPTGRGAVARALRLLHELRERIAGEPLLTQVGLIVATTKLRGRLLSLPPEEYENLGETLDELVLAAAVIEAEGLSLKAFADRLRDDFEKVREARATRPNAIQIITGHKAKGSEWPVVVVPFLGRKVGEASPSYPMVLKGVNGDPEVIFSKADREGSSVELVNKRSRHEAERLLYVTLTRAKHTLVMVDDRDLFRQKRGIPPAAQAHVLQLQPGTENEARFLRLPSEAMPSFQTMQIRREQHEERNESGKVVRLGALDPDKLANAGNRAGVFIKRNPSGLILPPSKAAKMDATKMPEPTAPSLTSDYPGKAYGTWWHRLLEEIDWKTDPASWQPIFDAAVPCSPDPDRAVLEWPLFVDATKLRGEWRPDAAICHSEMPFLWRLNDSECVEGIIDLAILDRNTGSWWIVDWKTNRIDARQAAWLKEIYEPQLSAYRAALRAITKAPVRAAIYSTPTGQWMDYDNAVLDARWRELAASPEALEEALCL